MCLYRCAPAACTIFKQLQHDRLMNTFTTQDDCRHIVTETSEAAHIILAQLERAGLAPRASCRTATGMVGWGGGEGPSHLALVHSAVF